MVTLELAIAGLGIGAIAALAGLGLLVTYRFTGVFNLAFGAVAMMAAYLLWQQVHVWHWPVGVAAAVDVLVVCPLFGLILERAVFRPLRRGAASTAERLVASLGVLVVLLGLATLVWGAQARLDAPSLVPAGQLRITDDLPVPWSTVADLAVIAAVAGLMVLGQRTRFGLETRAVVERSSLAELAGVSVDRVAAFGWACGCLLAGLAGLLIAPSFRLQPYTLTLVMLEIIAVVVIARLSSVGWAIGSALVIGVAQAELTQVHLSGRLNTLLGALKSNLFVVVLLVALMVMRRLDEPDAADSVQSGRLPSTGARLGLRAWWLVPAVTLAVPLLLGSADRRTALAVPALAIVLVSVVVVSGYGGQITLGQAGFAGLGALLAGRLTDGSVAGLPRLPGVVALVVAPLLVVPVGLLMAWPAIRRRGLFLALTTFAFGVAIGRFVFDQPWATAGVSVRRPSAFAADNNFYVLELLCLGVAFAVVHTLHTGRLGRALTAVRDDEVGAMACGIDVRRLKLVMFAAGAGLAALGGALLAMGDRAFDSASFDPIIGLLWFAAVVVFGVDSAPGAVIGAGVMVALDAAAPAGTSTLAIGVAALLLGRLPGGLVGATSRLLQRALTAIGGPPDAVVAIAPARLTAAGLAVHRAIRRPAGTTSASSAGSSAAAVSAGSSAGERSR